MHSGTKILVVDDDERMCVALAKVLAAESYSVQQAQSGGEALQLLKTQSFPLAITDLLLPDLDGISLLRAAREIHPEMEMVMLTGHASVERAVEAMRLGAYDFIEKPVESAVLIKTAAKALEKQRLSSENRRLRRQVHGCRGLDSLIGQSPAIRSIKDLVHQIASTDVAVLIQGESGTGKEIVAEAIHHLSERADKPMLKISCAAIPEALLESELFGHERGAFTGAMAAKPGKFELADGGTLLLDEIAEMSPQLQAKLLRVTQDGQFQRLGGTRDLQANVRLLAATHADIAARIAENLFRRDLYYRINTVVLSLPALRKRSEDIPLLANHFLTRFSNEMGRMVKSIAPGAMEQLLAHSWPGNVRELEHTIQRGVAVTASDTIKNFTFVDPPHPATPTSEAGSDGSGIKIPIGTTVEEATKKLVEATVEQCAGNKLQAARILGIPPRTMYRHFGKAN